MNDTEAEITFNRQWNSKNPHQGVQKKVLALCSAGLLRSPTVAWVLSNDPYNYNTRAAGTSHQFALIGVDPVLLDWADEIVCVEKTIKDRLMDYVVEKGLDISGKTVVTLSIPDRFPRRDPKLVKLIQEQYRAWVHTDPATRPV